jgi:hypothetical protein
LMRRSTASTGSPYAVIPGTVFIPELRGDRLCYND